MRRCLHICLSLIPPFQVLTGFSVVRTLAMGADVCNSARAMLFALGCIQSLKCNTNTCPTGITTQDPRLMHGLHVPSKVTPPQPMRRQISATRHVTHRSRLTTDYRRLEGWLRFL